jgi:hypothetical protein
MSKQNCPECGDRLDKGLVEHLTADCWVIATRQRQENLSPPLPEQIVALDATLRRDDGHEVLDAPPTVRFGVGYVAAA